MNSGIALYKPTDTRKRFYARGIEVFSICMVAQIFISDYIYFAHNRFARKKISQRLIMHRLIRYF